MPIFDLYSKRTKPKIENDVFQYDKIPYKLKAQIVHIFQDSMGDTYSNYNSYSHRERTAKTITDILCREYGIFKLVEYPNQPDVDLYNWFLNENDFDKNLDFIEIGLKASLSVERGRQGKISGEEAVEEYNQRALENSFGYQFENDYLIRVDSKLIHKEIIKPSLTLLNEEKYKNANDEYMEAHSDYKKGDYTDCLLKCAKSIETTMKIICESRKWPYKETDTAKRLIEVICDKGLIPKYLQTHYQSFQSVLESGVPVIRNKQAGHGKGNEESEVPQYLAQFQLNQTAALIVLLVEADKNLS